MAAPPGPEPVRLLRPSSAPWTKTIANGRRNGLPRLQCAPIASETALAYATDDPGRIASMLLNRDARLRRPPGTGRGRFGWNRCGGGAARYGPAGLPRTRTGRLVARKPALPRPEPPRKSLPRACRRGAGRRTACGRVPKAGHAPEPAARTRSIAVRIGRVRWGRGAG